MFVAYNKGETYPSTHVRIIFFIPNSRIISKSLRNTVS